MATFDQLSAEQRAILELVLQRSQSYETLAGMLSMREERVRELAHDALVHLAPVTAPKVEDEWRGQIADYVLGQQAGPESTATRGHLRRSEQARTWAGSLLDSLETLYGERALPSIPAGSRDRGRRPAAEERPQPELSPEARSAVRRRRRLAVILAVGVGLLVLTVLPGVGPLDLTDDGDDDGGGGGGGAAAQEETENPCGTGAPAGIAIVADRNGSRQLVVQAAGLDPSRQREAYEVWLYNSPEEAKSLGAQVTDSEGSYQGAGPLPEDFANYEFVDVSREPINDDGKHSGQTVLRGKLGKIGERSSEAAEDQAVIVGRSVLSPPDC
jgi:hypothetical protein